MKTRTLKHDEDCSPEDRTEGTDCGCRTCVSCGTAHHKDAMRQCDECHRWWCDLAAPDCEANAEWFAHDLFDGDLCGRCAHITSAKSDLDYDERAPLVFHPTPADILRAARNED